MSYVNKLEYKIVPTNTFKILRRCAGCGCKQIFLSKGNFRVNANGSRLDVWLIYGCEKCGYTYNLSIYERVKSDKIPKAQYQKFLMNDEKVIFRFGTDKSVFTKNRVEIAWDFIEYKIIPMKENKLEMEKKPLTIKVYNPCGIPVREDKVLANILQISRSKVTRLLNEGRLSVDMVKEDERR